MRVAIYGKKNCKICDEAKKKMKHFKLKKVESIDEWVDGTWVERDASGTLAGATDDNWKEFPDIDVLAFISFKSTDKVPLIWVDGEVMHYTEAMKAMKKASKREKSRPDPIRFEDIRNSHDECQLAMAAMA